MKLYTSRYYRQNILEYYMILQKENNVGLVTYEDECVVTGTRHDKYMEHEAKINGIRIKDVAPFPDYVNFNVNKCLMTAEPEKALEVENKLNEMYGNELSIYRSEPFFR